MDGEEACYASFQTAETGKRTPNSGVNIFLRKAGYSWGRRPDGLAVSRLAAGRMGVKGSGANHYPRAPALLVCEHGHILPL